MILDTVLSDMFSSAGAANQIGTAAQELGIFQKELARSLAHGSVGGLSSMAQGGKFKHGFFAGSFASMAGSGMEASKWGVFQTTVGGTVSAAVVGGTASTLGGGKFTNGAVTGAYTMLYNHMAHRPEDPPSAANEGGESGLPTLEGISIDLFHLSGSNIWDMATLFGNGITISLLKDSREYIGITITQNLNSKGAEATFIGINKVSGKKLDGSPLYIEDTFGYGITSSYGFWFGSYSNSSNSYQFVINPFYRINTVGISGGLPYANAVYNTRTWGFSIPTLPALLKKWTK